MKTAPTAVITTAKAPGWQGNGTCPVPHVDHSVRPPVHRLRFPHLTGDGGWSARCARAATRWGCGADGVKFLIDNKGLRGEGK
jgi:hypothetical protein